ncbi:gp37 long tail fiber distal subunit [Escherichia phage IME08]|uniref:Long tail fiber protein Gp37 n=1 Tax=Escherichia phage IME08 TaxID=698728 RepID=D2KFF6_9CAUD|nr:long tail fiber protein distal subunit [Escherichia phage IME08]ADA59471.1 receptor-recognizing protein gp37 [Escherichia phage IME08]ADI55564.1 gp37 long tail fiber distal subunit [Escherichia phage IME08]
MATLKSIQFKRSKTPGAKPTAAQLDEGELAINLRDRTIFTKSDQGQIIDLGFAKGGQVDGDVTINGRLTLEGELVQTSTAGMRTEGSITAPVFRASKGSFYSRASNDTANAHLWFENTNGSERAVLYAKPQLENEGVITMRVRQGTAAGAQNSEFHFISNDGGIFQARKLTALTSISTPTISVNLINHDSKAFGQYDSQSLVQYVYPGTGETNGVNYLRKVRAKSGGTMWHELCTAQLGQADELSWWTGNTPSSKQYGIRNDGRMAGRNSLALGTFTTDFPSSDYGNVGVMGDKYLVLGDTVTGLKYIKQGNFDLVGGGYSVASVTSDGFRGTSKTIFGRSNDQGLTWLLPGQNSSMVSIRTEIDGNNSGDGQTHLGYNSNGKLYHYFRGTGRVAISMAEGMIIEPGILNIKTGVNELNLRADGTVSTTQRLQINNGLVLNSNNNTSALAFTAPTAVDGTKTLNWDSGTRAGQNKNTVILKAWGNSFNAEKGNRETVWEVSDSQGYYFYAQRTNPAVAGGVGPVNFKFNGTVETGHIIGLGNISASGTGSFGGNVTMTNGLFVQGGASINGQVKMGGTADALRIWNAEYGMIFRRSETGSSASLHLIPTLQNAGENGGISDLRPLSINLANGTVIMGNKSAGYGPLFTVDNVSKFVQTDCRLRVNMDSDAIVVNASSQAASNFIQGRKADVTKWYLGIGDGGNVVRLHNYTYSHGIALNSDTVDITKPLKIGSDIRIGTDGNIIGSATLDNFKNLNSTLDHKVNMGGWAGGATTGWYKFATVEIPQSTGTASFKISGGSGFNFKSYGQASIAEIVLRTGNNNPKGLNATLWNRTSEAISQVASVNTSEDIYDIYVYLGGYSNSLVVEYTCSSNSKVTVVGMDSGVQPLVETLPEGHVVGKSVRMLNNIDGMFAAGESDIVTRGEYVTNNQKGMRIKSSGNDIGSNAALIRNDGGSFYILVTDKNTAENPNATDGLWNGLRPFSINMADGRVGMNHGLNITGGGLNVTGGNTNLGNITSRVVSSARAPGGWADNSDSTKSKITFMADHGDLSNSGSYYPIVGAWSNYGSAGYRQTFEFGWVGTGTTAGWRDGIIRIRGDNATGQQARWRFTMDGLLDCPGKVQMPQTSAFGVNTTNSLGGSSITFGDSDTGIKQNGDGLLDIYANNIQVFRFQNGDLYSYKNINAPNVYIRSDIRLKSNFRPIENALEKVEQLDGLIYDKAEYIGGEAVQTEAGVIAQSLEEVLPEAICEAEDIKGNKVLTVSTQAQVALLIEAVKTLSAKVRELEAKLN